MNPDSRNNFLHASPILPPPDTRKRVKDLIEDVQDAMFGPTVYSNGIKKVSIEACIDGVPYKLTLERA